MSDMEAATLSEVEKWRGASVEFQHGGKHKRAIVTFGKARATVIYAATCSDGGHGLKNHIGEIRRALKALGARPPAKPQSSGTRRACNKPVREMQIGPAPVIDNPFDALANVEAPKNTQCRRLLGWLKERREIDPLTAWSELGIYRLGARVFDLRKMGHPITSDRKLVENRFGEECRVALYKLESAAQ